MSSLINAHINKQFDDRMLQHYSVLDITEAAVWALENNKLWFFKKLRPHSEFNIDKNVLWAATVAIEHGGVEILEHLRKDISKVVRDKDNILFRTAVQSTQVAGLQWLIRSKQFFGFNNDYFARKLRDNCTRASYECIDVLARSFPEQRFEWFMMAQDSVSHNNMKRCMVFLEHAARQKMYTHDQMKRVARDILTRAHPKHIGGMVDLWEQMQGTPLTHEQIQFVFHTGLLHNDAECSVHASFSRFGTNFNFQNEDLENFKASHIKKLLEREMPTDRILTTRKM